MNKIIEKYMGTYEEFSTSSSFPVLPEVDYYKSFLGKTDYIASKLAEGVATKEDYAEELEAREYARSEIRRLEMM